MQSLDPRLSAIAEFVRDGVSVCDVGTDHAYLPCFLAEHGWIDVYACDINPKPLARAKAEIERRGAGVVLLRSDGLKEIPVCGDVVIAGMGGELIAEIVAAMPPPFLTAELRLILQPMTRHETLRRFLYKSGFEIIAESAIKDGGKVYVVIHARYTGKAAEIPDVTAFIGVSGDVGYIKNRLAYLEKLGRGDSRYKAIYEEIRNDCSGRL